MTDDPSHIQEHDLPAVEAVIAASMALMTAYSQALQAELHPRDRLAMGRRIVAHLTLLRRQPALSTGFGEVLQTLLRCWQTMQACTQDAAICRGVSAGDGRPAPFGDGAAWDIEHLEADDHDRDRDRRHGDPGWRSHPKRLH